MKVNLGGDRIGSGNNMNIDLHNYGRSTHNLSKMFASSMTCGLLYPCYVNVGLPGDKFDINLNAGLRTIPTKGPLFGKFKVQIEMYKVPIRLYNAILHNNPIDIGLKMNQVVLPFIDLYSMDDVNTEDYTTNQVNPSNLWKYLGLSGLGRVIHGEGEEIKPVNRRLNALPLLVYYDIFKCYYANKQEENAYVVTVGFEKTRSFISSITWAGGEYTTDDELEVYPNNGPIIIKGRDLIKDGKLNIQILSNQPNAQAYFNIGNWNGNESDSNIVYLFPQRKESIELKQKETLYKKRNIELVEFPLENIDIMRNELLSRHTIGSGVEISTLCEENGIRYPYLAASEIVDNETQNDYLLKYPLAGLVCKTYNSDLYNNWIRSEFITGDNGINEITRVNTEGGLSMDALLLAQKVYNMLNRIAVTGGTYEDYLEAVYTQDTIRKCETPMYVGGYKAMIDFEEIVSTAQTDTNGKVNPLGTMGGRGVKESDKGGRFEIECDEPCIIMGIASITPMISYSQGNKWYLTDLKTIDDLHKPALDGIGYQDLLVEQMAWWGTTLDESGPQERLSAGKTIAWANYMTDVDECYGDFATSEGKSFMVLNRNYSFDKIVIDDAVNVDVPTDITTYIDPSKFNYAFAYSELDAQNFWVKIKFDIKARRVMSAKQIPNL